MGLKVAGSNPASYPIIYNSDLYDKGAVAINWCFKSKSKSKTTEKKKNLLKQEYLTNELLPKNFNSRFVKINKLLWYKYLFTILKLNYINLGRGAIDTSTYLYNFSLISNDVQKFNDYRGFYKLKLDAKYDSKLEKYKNLVWDLKFNFIKSFKLFIQTNLYPSTVLFKTNPSWKSFFIDHSGNLKYFLLKKLFTKFKTLIYLLYTIYFFELKIIYFGNSLFKDETNSLNWVKLKNFISLWRYVLPFFTLKTSKIFNQAWIIFYKLRLNGYYTAFIIDLQYHIKTLYYLNRSQYYIIGVVPVWYNSNLVSFAIPVPNDSVVSQLFILRLVLLILKNTHKIKFESSFKLWLSYKNNN